MHTYTAASAPVELRLPPYDRGSIVIHPDSGGGVAVIAIVAVEPDDREGTRAAATVLTVRRRLPGAAIVLLVCDLTPSALTVAVRAMVPAVRGVLFGASTTAGLRTNLTRSQDLGAGVVAWLGDVGIPVARPALELVAEIVDAPSRGAPSLSAFLSTLERSERTARNWFRNSGLPAPRAFFSLARVLHAALAIQRDGDRSFLDIAVEAGYADAAGLAHQIGRAVGLRPGNVRGTLGWEWLLERWCRRAGLLPAHFTTGPRQR
jgi:AraC-like DNA-binding protein